MTYINRLIQKSLTATLKRPQSILLLGPRQTGKTTLLSNVRCDLTLSFLNSALRQRYEKDPSLLHHEVLELKRKIRKQPLILLDEIQKVPDLMDVIQDLIDQRVAQFILTGSSARKLKRGTSINLLPGRVRAMRLDPLLYREYPERPLENELLYGSLPAIATNQNRMEQESDLESYVTTYLEEEVRAEAIVRNLGLFGRFLEYAASESGHLINLSSLSQQIGVSHPTINGYYQILEDCLLIERIEPLLRSKTRKKLIKAQKYLFFDLGVRRVAAHEGTKLPKEQWGLLLEQWVGLQLIRSARLASHRTRILFWRDADGPEVDWVIDQEGRYTPIEVKWSEAPTQQDAKHLLTFLAEYPEAKHGYIVCRTPRPFQIYKNVTAIPWTDLATV